MSKVLYIYGGFSAAQLKSRASIPSQADITVGSNYIDCSSVDIPSEIRDIIGEGSNDLGTIYCSAKVNKWSGFGPREWYVSAGVLLDRPRSNPYDMANFCGYNHNAITPYITNAASLSLASGLANQSYSFFVNLNLAEINWFAQLGLTHCHVVVDGVIKASFATETDYIGNAEKVIEVTVTLPAAGVEQTYTIETWFGAVANKQGKLTQGGNTIKLKVLIPALFTSLMVLDTAANRAVIDSAESLTTEYCSAIFTETPIRSISSTNLSGKYSVTAELRFNSNGGYSRTINVPLSDLIYCKVKCYKINGGVTSAIYDINTNYRILYTSGGTAFDFAIPTALKPIADGDNYYITFENLV